MNANLQAMKAQVDKINPDLLTGQERLMYEYLKLLQNQLTMTQGRMGMAQEAMLQMAGIRR